MLNTVRRTLTLIKFFDGVWVVETKKPLHHPGTSYASESKFSLFGIFKDKTFVYQPAQKAERALKDVLGFLTREDIEVKPHFHREGAEWHPVIVRLDQYWLKSELLKKKSDWKVTPLGEHRFVDKLQGLVPGS